MGWTPGDTGVTGVAFVRTCGWNAWNVIGRSCKTHGCISRRSLAFYA